MLKLMKYEVIRSKYWFILTACAMFLAQALILIGRALPSDPVMTTGIVLFVMLGYFGLIGLLIFAVQIFSSDLSKKHGYMVFLTPHSAYAIIGSKLIVALFALIVGFAIYAALALFNISFLTKNSQILQMVAAYIPKDLTSTFVGVAFALLLEWFVTIVTIYFAIALTHTLLAQVKFKGLIATVVFLLINWGIAWLTFRVFSGRFLLLTEHLTGHENLFAILRNFAKPLLSTLLIGYTLLGGVFYLGTSWMVEKKMSL